MPKKDFFKEISIVHNEMGSLLKDLLNLKSPQAYYSEHAWHPPTDVVETDDEFIVVMEIPGIEKKGISVNLAEGTLEISGCRYQKTPDKACKYHRVEIFCGNFKQQIAIGSEIDDPKISASYANGFLEIILPKKKHIKKDEKKIQVEKC